MYCERPPLSLKRYVLSMYLLILILFEILKPVVPNLSQIYLLFLDLKMEVLWKILRPVCPYASGSLFIFAFVCLLFCGFVLFSVFQEFFSGIADRHFFTFLLEVRVPSNFKTDGAIFLEKILVLEFLIRKGSKWAQNEVFKFYEMSTHRNCLNFCKKVLQHKALKLIFSDFWQNMT